MKNSSMSIKNFVKMGGSYQNEHIFKVAIQRLVSNENEEELLVRYFFLLTKTNFLPPEVYDVLVKRFPYDDVTKRYGIGMSTLKNKIYNTSRKVFDELTLDPYVGILEHSLPEGTLYMMVEHINRIIMHQTLLDNVSIQDQLLWDMQQYNTDMNYGYHKMVNLEEFSKLLQVLRPLSKPYLVKIMARMDKQLLAYLGYLVSTPDAVLPKDSQEHKDIMRRLWWITGEDVND